MKYAGRGDLFEGLSIWQERSVNGTSHGEIFADGKYKYREIQGTYPVISISFANVKEREYATVRRKICQMLTDLYIDYSFLLESDALRKAIRNFSGGFVWIWMM